MTTIRSPNEPTSISTALPLFLPVPFRCFRTGKGVERATPPAPTSLNWPSHVAPCGWWRPSLGARRSGGGRRPRRRGFSLLTIDLAGRNPKGANLLQIDTGIACGAILRVGRPCSLGSWVVTCGGTVQAENDACGRTVHRMTAPRACNLACLPLTTTVTSSPRCSGWMLTAREKASSMGVKEEKKNQTERNGTVVVTTAAEED